MKKAFDRKTYQKLYPSSSQPGLYFGVAKVHKVPINSNNVNDLPLRPIISNCGTATYETSRYLAGILFPLTKNNYTITNTLDFINRIKGLSIREDEKMVSFDVSSLFSNVPLDFTIDLILKKVYDDNIINIKLKRDQLKELLELCTKQLHFSFNGEMYRQADGVAMGSPLGPVIANIFMSELENELVPQLGEKMSLWLRYVDDTFTVLGENEVINIKAILNNFHPNINFTHEIEIGSTISFLDVKVTRNNANNFSTSVYRKQTDTNVYIHWKAHAPKSWKIGTLKGLFRRALLVSSTEENLKNEIQFLKQIFTNINKYPKSVVENTLKNVKSKIARETAAILGEDVNVSRPTIQSANDDVAQITTHPHIILPYKGFKGENIIKNMKKVLHKFLPKTVIPRFIYKGKKLGSFFSVKDKVDDKHQSDLVYGYNIPEVEASTYDYIGQSSVRHETRVYEHAHTDKNSSIYKYSHENNFTASPSDFSILAKGYHNWLDRRICEALYVKDHKPFLNKQKNSHKLELFT